MERRGQPDCGGEISARNFAIIRSAPDPFIFREWRERDQVMLDANPDYWKGKPKVDHLVFKEYPDAQAALLALKRGDVQIMGDVATPVIASIRGDANLVLLTQPGSGGERHGDAKRSAAIHRQAGATGAELCGGQGGDRQGAVRRAGDADGFAAAGGAMGLRQLR